MGAEFIREGQEGFVRDALDVKGLNQAINALSALTLTAEWAKQQDAGLNLTRRKTWHIH